MVLNTLRGIRVESFAHPKERAALAALGKAGWLKRLLDWAVDQKNLYTLKTQVLGNCVGITKRDMPELYQLVEEVCMTLDYQPVPRLFICHSQDFEIGVSAGSPALLVFPDFVMNEFEPDMMRFQVGRAITALKADTCQLKMLAAAVHGVTWMIPGIGDAAAALLADWSRKADLTEDRGGLLACQDIRTARRVLMWTAGMPYQYLDVSRIVPYIRICQEELNLVTASRYMQTINRMKSWNNDRIIELDQWYQSGEYDDLIEEYE